MPQLGESVTEGTLVRWIKRAGERIERDEPLYEVTTDKVNAEVPSPVAGTLISCLVEEGAVVPVGTVVAHVAEATADLAVPIADGAAATPSSEAGDGSTPAFGERRRYSPVVRKLADEHNVNIDLLTGTGVGGRVSKEDVLAFLSRQNSATTQEERIGTVAHEAPERIMHEPQREMATTAQPADEMIVPLTAMRKGIADHMVHSVYSAPHVTTVAEVDMTRLVRWREANRDRFRTVHGVDISYVAFVVQAVVEALRAFPLLNSSWGGDCIVVKKHLNIGIAVALEDGLLVPVIHKADERSVVGLSRALDDLAKRARSGTLALHELQGGTFTVNNTGTFGSIVSTPIINQPQAAILSMEAIVKRPVVVDDAIAIRSMMNLCLSFDHRILDGLLAGRFMQAVRRSLETASAVAQI